MKTCTIVGGGMIGLSTAWQLARRGVRVTVLDRGPLGNAASWAGAGILPPANAKTATDPWEQLRGWSHELHRQWAEELERETGIAVGFVRCGAIYLARTAGEAATLCGLAAYFQEREIPIHRLAPEELLQREPALKEAVQSGQVRVAYWVPEEYQMRPPWYLKALLAACARHGVQLLAHHPVHSFRTAGARAVGVVTEQGEIPVERLVLATGAWTWGLLERLGVGCGIFPVRGQIVLYRAARPLLGHILMEGSRYLVPRPDGRILAGSTEEEVGFDERNTPEGVQELRGFAEGLIPELAHVPVEKTWAGLRPGSIDGLPYLGPVPGYENVWVAAGHFRSGLHTAPGTAVVMARLVLGEDPGIDLTPFHLARSADALPRPLPGAGQPVASGTIQRPGPRRAPPGQPDTEGSLPP